MSSTLINRPERTTRPAEPPAPRPLTTTAMLGGAGAALGTLALAMAVAVAGWFLADAGGHGATTDALRVGADTWLMGLGSHLEFAGAPIGIVPLALTWLLLSAAFKAARWAARTSAPVPSVHALGSPLVAFTGSYLVVAVITCVLATETGATPGLGRAVVGSLLVGLVGGALGLAVGSGRLRDWTDRLPGWVRLTAYGAVAGALGVLAAGAALVTVSLLVHLNDAATVFSELHVSAGEALSYTVVMALFAPNAALLGAAYLIGPGFAFGTGTVVSPTAVSLGAMPAVPLLAALPPEGPAPGWLAAALAVPVLVAAGAAAAAQRRSEQSAYDLAALRGAVVGAGAGVLLSLLIGLAGGPLGTGRMADVGAPFFEVLVFATGGMGAGGLLGGLAAAWWQRRQAD